MHDIPMPQNEITKWIPQAGSQVLFLTCPIFECLYEGTRGPGKTDALLMAFAKFVGMGFGMAWRGIIFRRTYPELQDIITKSKRWFRLIFPTAKYNETAHEWRWPTGEALLFRHMKKPDDYWSYHGHEYPFIGWEELTNWPDDKCYKLMMSCCRSAHPGIWDKEGNHVPIPRIVRATTNPYGPGHNWVKSRWRLPAGRGIVIDDAYDSDGNLEPPRVAIHGSIYENKILLSADPSYITKIAAAARNPSERKAWLEGSWDVVAGGMFDDVWAPEYNQLRPTNVPRSWYFTRSFDWGSSKPFSVGWWAVSDGTDLTLADGSVMHTVRGDMFRIGEYYGCVQDKPNTGLRLTAKQIATEINKREKRMGISHVVDGGIADAAIFNVENRMCIATDMEEEGIYWDPADKKPGSRKQGWETMRQALQNAHPNKDGTPREYPGLFVFDTCLDFIRTVPSLPRDDDDLDDVDTDAEDHVADETRYFVRRVETDIEESDF